MLAQQTATLLIKNYAVVVQLLKNEAKYFVSRIGFNPRRNTGGELSVLYQIKGDFAPE
jgi:hypothetical protein